MSKRTKRIIISLLIIFALSYISICFYTASRLTIKTNELVTTVYESSGIYDGSEVISEKDYNTIAAGSYWKGDYANDELNWDYYVDYIHTFSFGFKAYTYVQDACYLSSPSGDHVSGYCNRPLRIDWTFKNGQYRVEKVYDYITPGIIHRLFDFLFD